MIRVTVPFRNLTKTAIIVSLPALIVLAVMAVKGEIGIASFAYGYGGILLLSLLFVRPFLASVSELTHYVNSLAQDKRVQSPNLGMLSAVGELSESLGKLQRSWEKQKQQMESVITEREILVDTLPDILIMINDDRMIARTNRAARTIFGQNLAHRSLQDVIPSEALVNAVIAVVEDLKGREIEFHLEEPEAHDFLAIIERFPIPSAGGISVIITLNDITELKRVEQMRADFVANASHEIRTPLASIMGFIETIQGPAKDDPEAQQEFLKLMGEQAQRMNKLVRDLLSLSKIEMSAHSVPIGKVDLLRIVRGEKQNFEWAVKQKNMTIKLDYHDNLPPVRGDESELAQVIHNLIGNAIKYGFPDTEVKVSIRVTPSLPSDPFMRNLSRAVCITVQDKGEGIPKQHIPRLTERFYRVDSARSRAVGGTGLGLAIVKHILNRHRGVITIDSVVGQGSSFHIYLPLYEGE